MNFSECWAGFTKCWTTANVEIQKALPLIQETIKQIQAFIDIILATTGSNNFSVDKDVKSSSESFAELETAITLVENYSISKNLTSKNFKTDLSYFKSFPKVSEGTNTSKDKILEAIDKLKPIFSDLGLKKESCNAWERELANIAVILDQRTNNALVNEGHFADYRNAIARDRTSKNKLQCIKESYTDNAKQKLQMVLQRREAAPTQEVAADDALSLIVGADCKVRVRAPKSPRQPTTRLFLHRNVTPEVADTTRFAQTHTSS